MDILSLVPQLTNHFPEPKINGFSHVVERLDLYWGEKEFPEYMSSLLIRDNHRIGFPDQVIRELMFIKATHEKAFPNLSDSKDLHHFVFE